MFSLISSLLQDVCDVGFAVGRGALALILVIMEESRLSWLDLTAVQEVRDKYCYRSVVANTSSQSAHSASFSSNRNSKPKAVRGAQRRIDLNQPGLEAVREWGDIWRMSFSFSFYPS